jgi:hypothetical protein
LLWAEFQIHLAHGAEFSVANERKDGRWTQLFREILAHSLVFLVAVALV